MTRNPSLLPFQHTSASKLWFVAIVIGLVTAQSVFASADHDAYTKIFPVHAEFCSLSEIKGIGQKSGGNGGHAVLWVEGLCKDYSAAYPKVIPCSKAKSQPGIIQTGVGISVDNDYRSANWTVVPQYDLFMFGVTPDAGRVDQVAIDATVAEATRLRAFEGVKFNPDLVASGTKQPDYVEQVARNTIGTDVAIRFGRDMECVRMPVPESKLQAMADYLNERNEPYVTGKKEYKWNALGNNCAMLAADTLAAALIRPSIPMDRPIGIRLLTPGIPRNGFSTLASIALLGARPAATVLGLPHKKYKDASGVEHANLLEAREGQGDYSNFETMSFENFYGDDFNKYRTLLVKSMSELGSMPTGFGALLRSYKIYSDNRFYETKDLTNFVFGDDIPGSYKESVVAFKIKAFTNLKESAKYWNAVYSAALESSRQFSARAPIKLKERETYEAFIQKEIARVKASGLL